jgi:hypothetical protein
MGRKNEPGDELSRQFSERLGIQLVALREIEEAGLRVCELEILSPEPSPANGWRWVDRREAAAALRHTPPGLGALVLAWFRQSSQRRRPTTRPPWEQKGWYNEAVAWIEEQLARLSRTPTGPVEQVKTAWSCSSILRVPTTEGHLYFKATYARPPAEVTVIQQLARRWPRHVPTLVAADVDRRWMLMEDFGSRELWRLPFARSPGAVRLFGRVQRECSADVSHWLGVGCPDRRIDQLARSLEPLLSDPHMAQADPPFRPGNGDLDRLRAESNSWAQEFLELGNSPLPASIVQQDFQQGNVAIHGRQYLFFDWSDTVVSHPFWSACRFLDYVGSGGGSSKRKRSRRLTKEIRHERLIDAYLDAWAEYAPRDQLRAVFRQAQRLNRLYLAIRWHLELPYCEPGSPWWREMVSWMAGSLQEFVDEQAGS